MMASAYSRPPVSEIKLLKVIYVGRTKPRGNSPDRSAVAWMNGRWSVILPESVLRDWFEPGLTETPATPAQKATLFTVLMLTVAATADEVRTAYRRLVKVTHPDVCKDPDAGEQFKRVQSAYEVLSDPLRRRKYELGLKLETQLAAPPVPPLGRYGSLYIGNLASDGYRAPLRSGYVLAQGSWGYKHKWFVVEKILEWRDVTDSEGRVLVSSWPAGSDEPVVIWQ